MKIVNSYQLINYDNIVHFKHAIETPAYAIKYLVPGEQVLKVFQTDIDIALFTNKRLIFRDACYYGEDNVMTSLINHNIPYESIKSYTINLYTVANNEYKQACGELTLLSLVGNTKIIIEQGIDIYELDKFIATQLL